MKPDINSDLLAVRERILKLATRFDIKNLKKGGGLARRLGVHNSVITRLIQNESFPGLDNLIKICKNANISADYLLFGKESGVGISEMANRYESRQPAPVDMELVAKVVQACQQYLEEHRLRLSPARMGDWVARVYEHCATEKDPPTPPVVKQYLGLTR